MNQTSIVDLLSLENEVFRSYIFYSTLLIVKVFLIVPLIAYKRIKYMVSVDSRYIFTLQILCP